MRGRDGPSAWLFYYRYGSLKACYGSIVYDVAVFVKIVGVAEVGSTNDSDDCEFLGSFVWFEFPVAVCGCLADAGPDTRFCIFGEAVLD